MQPKITVCIRLGSSFTHKIIFLWKLIENRNFIGLLFFYRHYRVWFFPFKAFLLHSSDIWRKFEDALPILSIPLHSMMCQPSSPIGSHILVSYWLSRTPPFSHLLIFLAWNRPLLTNYFLKKRLLWSIFTVSFSSDYLNTDDWLLMVGKKSSFFWLAYEPLVIRTEWLAQVRPIMLNVEQEEPLGQAEFIAQCEVPHFF